MAAARDNDWEDKYDNAAKQEANTCFNLIELSYEITIVEDIEELVSTAWTRYFLVGCCLICLLYITFLLQTRASPHYFVNASGLERLVVCNWY